MQITRFCTSALFLSLLGFQSVAQGLCPFHLPTGLPVPEWVGQANWASPNVFQTDSLIHLYKTSHRDEQTSERDFHEDPYLTAYIRWRHKMAPFIQPDGSIVYDSGYYRRQVAQSLDRQSLSGRSHSGRRTTSAANWTILGPVQTYGDAGGGTKNEQANIYCLAIAPSNPSVLYAGSEPGTLYRSADKGLHWTSVSDTVYSCGTQCIVVDPTNENIVYTYDGTSDVLLKSTTGGTGWTILSGFTGGTGNAMAINATTGRILITGTTSVYYSDNGGTTWTAATGGAVTGTLYDVALNPSNPDTVYAVGNTSANLLVLLRSTNGGTTFTNVTGALSSYDCGGARLGVTTANSNYVYCVDIGSSAPPCIIRTTDRGATWDTTVTSSTTGLTGSGATTGLGMSDGQGYYDLSIVVSQTNAQQVIVGTTTTYKSTDGGANFSPIGGYAGSLGLHPDMQQAVALGGDTYIATDGGINYSTDFFTNAANWSVRNNGLSSSEFWGFGQGWDEDLVVGGRYHNGNTAIYAGYGTGNGLSLGGGEDATGHVFHGHSLIAGFRDIGMTTLPSSATGAIQYSAPDVPNSLWPQDDYYGLFSSRLVIDPRYSNIFYLGQDSILWQSTNSGASYTALHNFGSGNTVWRFDIARSNPSVIYVCTHTGFYKTTDAGLTWTMLLLPATWSYYNTDVVVNPLNAQEVYVCMANGAPANKVFRSTNGGATWTNITGTVLNNQPVAFLQYQAGTASGVYAVTNTRPSKVYYKDSTMADWTSFSTGLPENIEAREGALIFYRDNKIRSAGCRSVWESPLYTTGAPVAQPMADRKFLGCTRDTVNFFDYSMYAYAGASRLWSFPGASWVSSDTALKPQVLYPGPGYYNVSLKITDGAGRTNTHMVDSMIVVSSDICGYDTVPGQCLQLTGTNQTISLGKAAINSNTFSISCWVQPYGLQSSFSQIISHDIYPGSGGSGFGFGFKFNGYTPNLNLCYTDSLVTWTNSSSLNCDSTQWNYVVLTYSPGGVVLYLNGVADTVNHGPMPVIDLSQSPFVVNLDNHQGQGSRYNGKIDEVKFYNYTLSQVEVRQKMHLITNPATETGLIKYFQFNQYDAVNGYLYDVVGDDNTFVPNANIVTSTAPVATGLVYRNPMVNSAGLNSFAAANVSTYLPAGGTYPDGEVVAFHLFSNPDTKPDYRPSVKGYYIINNYGANATFTVPDSLVLSGMNIPYSGDVAGDFRLFSRPTGAFGNTWSAELDSACTLRYAPASSSLTWNAHSGITAFNRQFIVVNNDTVNHHVGTGIEEKEGWVVSALYPNPAHSFTRLDIVNPGGAGAQAEITVADIKGTEILHVTNTLSPGPNTLMIPTQRLPPGVYTLQVYLPGQYPQIRKLVVE